MESVASSSADRSTAEPLLPKQRSRISNGAALFVETDHRTAWARRFRDVLGDIVSDLGGADLLSEGQKRSLGAVPRSRSPARSSKPLLPPAPTLIWKPTAS
jgi:hypothetical protein